MRSTAGIHRYIAWGLCFLLLACAICAVLGASSPSGNGLTYQNSGAVPTSTTVAAPPITDGSYGTVTVTVTALGGVANANLRAFAARFVGSVPTGTVLLSVDGGTPFSIGLLNSQGTVTYGLLKPSGGPGSYNL